MTTCDDQRDALGDFERKKHDNFVRNMMVFATVVIGILVMFFTMFPSHDEIELQKQAQFHLRDKMDCQHLQQDMVYRGWNTSKIDYTDPYLAYDLKLHDERGCKP